MQNLSIELLGSPQLRARADDVVDFDEDFRALVEAMFRTMYRAQGQGLAGPQVGVLQRVVVIDLPPEDTPALVLANPRIVEVGAEKEKFEEGCLSIPGVSARVERATEVVVEAKDETGEPFRLEAEGDLAGCIQHEVDHLDGVLYIDHLSPLKRQLVLSRYRELAGRREA